MTIKLNNKLKQIQAKADLTILIKQLPKERYPNQF